MRGGHVERVGHDMRHCAIGLDRHDAVGHENRVAHDLRHALPA